MHVFYKDVLPAGYLKMAKDRSQVGALDRRQGVAAPTIFLLSLRSLAREQALRLIDGEHTVVCYHYTAANERRANGKARPTLHDEQKTQKRDEASPPEV